MNEQAQKIRVLVVDDEALARGILRRLLLFPLMRFICYGSYYFFNHYSANDDLACTINLIRENPHNDFGQKRKNILKKWKKICEMEFLIHFEDVVSS